ncbi:hypothetical protein QAD02_000387 [Eretmocerus hayati]|uniref:Uncharacterized protein n=1 Tax=Eretmocerus hayati TaxID=131215 RepID=A0ACC2NDC2_9HYME|nr:hypothetical protein QAD02_000387 [Eretmocerus hayati]
MKKATNTAIRINTLHMAKAKLKTVVGNNKFVSSNGGYKGSEVYTSEFEINETLPSARTLLTKGYIQDEINSFSGATVSTRGRFMTEPEKARCPHERPLYLYIQGHSKHNVDKAIQKINEIIKTEHRSSSTRPSRFTNAPPPLMSLHSGVSSVEKICVGIENAPPGFDLRGRIIGAGGANLLYIRGETGATVILRGRGSQFIDPALGAESPEPLHLWIEHPSPVALQNAKQLAINLIQTMQSELQAYVQQQPPPVQSQQVVQQSMQHMPPAHYQPMNMGTLGQPNVVTIHREIIPHPPTMLTATVTGAPVSSHIHPPGPHGQAPGGPIPPAEHQEMQPFVPPSSCGQIMMGPPSVINQGPYPMHPSQPMPIQGMPPPGSQNSAQPMAQIYAMSQPPPQQNFMSSSGPPVNGVASFVYSQPRPNTPSQGPMHMNQQPPPTGPQPLMQLQFPPPFPPNQPPPPNSQPYQPMHQYQPVPSAVAQAPSQFVMHHGAEPPPPPQAGHEPPPPMMGGPPPQYEAQPPQMHGPPPPPSQGYLVPTSQAMQPEHAQQPPMPPPGADMHHLPEEQSLPPQPVPPPQMVPPPTVNQIPHSMSMITSVPPPSHPPPQAAPWLYQGQPMSQPPPQGQMPVQMPPTSVPHHVGPPPEMQPPMQYHAQQVHYQNGHIPAQMHYGVQSPQPQHHFEPNSDVPEHQKVLGMKRRFSEVDRPPEPLMHQIIRPPIQRHANGEADQPQHHMMHGPPGAGSNLPPGERKHLLMPPPYSDERRSMDQQFLGHNPGMEQPMNGEVPRGPPPPGPPMGMGPGAHSPWQGHFARFPPNRPPPIPREGPEQHHMMPYHGQAHPHPVGVPPPQLRLVQGVDGNRSPSQLGLLEQPHPVSMGLDYAHLQQQHQSPFTMKPGAPPPAAALVQSICNPPPPPASSPPAYTQPRPRGPPFRYHHPHQVPVSQQPNVSAPPWMN